MRVSTGPHRELVATSSDVEILRQRLLDCAHQWAPMLLGSGTDPRVWRLFGMRVMRRDLGPLRGLLRWSSGERGVAVNERDHPRIQRFTAAHELAHTLMAGLDRRRIGLTGGEEEQLCDLFASHLLIPRDDLEQALAEFEDDPLYLIELTKRYDVGLSHLLRATGEVLPSRDVVAFAVSKRGHRERPNEVAMRVHRVSCAPYLLPEETRLTSLGLSCLANALEAGTVEVEDEDWGIRLPLWQPRAAPRSGTAEGTASWRAHRLPNDYAVVCLHTSGLTHRWARHSRLSAA